MLFNRKKAETKLKHKTQLKLNRRSSFSLFDCIVLKQFYIREQLTCMKLGSMYVYRQVFLKELRAGFVKK